jgi:hypothetical protein
VKDERGEKERKFLLHAPPGYVKLVFRASM